MLPEQTALTSGALAYAMECGLPPRMSYTVAETARYSGMSE